MLEAEKFRMNIQRHYPFVATSQRL